MTNTLYKLVLWPDYQKYMELPDFVRRCSRYVATPSQEEQDEGFFVPVDMIEGNKYMIMVLTGIQAREVYCFEHEHRYTDKAFRDLVLAIAGNLMTKETQFITIAEEVSRVLREEYGFKCIVYEPNEQIPRHTSIVRIHPLSNIHELQEEVKQKET